ncbi:MAG TPA: hypothetical protein DCR62_02605 [Acholeplasmatales bacterium]|nr:hypothetical protein [Acholeplasmatales bacterium]
MNYTLEEKYNLIKDEVLRSVSKNSIEIVKFIMHRDFVNIHGPEHHFLDGAAFLMAFYNAGGQIDVDIALDELAKRTIKMPGAMCGDWGICGSTVSVGAVLSIIHKTNPLSSDDFYKHHMEYASQVISAMSKIGGPRCCKRNAFLSLSYAVRFVKEKYDVEMDLNKVECEFTDFNQQCLKEKCPFHKI